MMKTCMAAMAWIALTGITPTPALAAPVYTITGDPGEQTLVAQTPKGALSQTMGEYMARIEAQADFDGDGIADALLSTNCGGNGCPESTFAFVTLKAGTLRVTPIGDALAGRVVDVRGTKFVELTQLAVTRTYVLTGTQAAPYSTQKHLVLHPVIAVEGLAPGAASGTRSFETDVDLDGKRETIQCKIWERWGSLLCALPTPGGVQVLSTGCMRFGPLPTSANGRREFVCNENLVVRFDGKRWMEPKRDPPPRRNP